MSRGDGQPAMDNILGSVARATDADPRVLMGPLQGRLRSMMLAFEEVKTATYEGLAADGEVVATVDGKGALLDLDISPYAMRDFDHVALGLACARAILSAREALAEAMRSAMESLPEVDVNEDETLFDPTSTWQRAMEASGWVR